MNPLVEILVVLGAFTIMILGLSSILAHLKEEKQGFGQNTTKLIGVVLFLPTLLILAVLGVIPKETSSTLLGIIAGYVLNSISAASQKKKASKDKGDRDEN